MTLIFFLLSFAPTSQYMDIDLVVGKTALYMTQPQNTQVILQRIVFSRILFCGLGPPGSAMAFVSTRTVIFNDFNSISTMQHIFGCDHS